MEPLTELRHRVNQAPTDPGIYRWLNKTGDVLYIGKAKHLRNRLRSYVQEQADKSLGPWKRSLREHIADFDVTVTSTELEALILETNLIKELKPKYNVLMKDDKNYVYVRVTVRDPYPTVTVVRQMENDDAKYFGPYLSSYEINRTLDLLQKVINYRERKDTLERLNRAAETGESIAVKESLELQIGESCGVGVGTISQEEYRQRIEDLIAFLRGNHQPVLKRGMELMQEAAATKKFEKAAKLRDTVKYIQSLSTTQTVSDTSRADTDAVGVAMQAGKIQVVVLRERGGKVRDEHSLALKGEADDVMQVLTQFIPQYYAAATDLPATILIAEPMEEMELTEAWLSQLREKKVVIHVPERGKKSKLLNLAEANAKQKISQQMAKWEAASQNIATALKELKEAINLPDIPKRIEGYDISHLGGTETVGSMVVMKNGKPANKEYRSFTIKTMSSGEIDDYKALKEVLSRRLRYIQNDKDYWEKKGITVSKARKNEEQQIKEISQGLRGKIGDDAIDYKDYTVARSVDTVVGFARLFKRPGGIWQLRSVWVKDEYRGEKLGHVIIRKILKSAKQDKVYLIIDPQEHLEEYYQQVGFRHVITPPKVLLQATEVYCKEHPNAQPGIIMVHIAEKNKTDNSLQSTPDLLVIDGGKGQLSAVLDVLRELELTIPCIGIAKREEEIFTAESGSSTRGPIDLPKTSQGSFLLQRLRDEAHRFANAHREKRLLKSATTSALDDVPGIGQKTKLELLKRFGSVQGVVEADDQALLAVVNQGQLAALRSALHSAE